MHQCCLPNVYHFSSDRKNQWKDDRFPPKSARTGANFSRTRGISGSMIFRAFLTDQRKSLQKWRFGPRILYWSCPNEGTLNSCQIVGTLFERASYHFSVGTNKAVNFPATFSIILSQNAFRLFDRRKSRMIDDPSLMCCCVRTRHWGLVCEKMCSECFKDHAYSSAKNFGSGSRIISDRHHISWAWKHQGLQKAFETNI